MILKTILFSQIVLLGSLTGCMLGRSDAHEGVIGDPNVDNFVQKRGCVVEHSGQVSFNVDNLIVALDMTQFREFGSQMERAKVGLDRLLHMYKEHGSSDLVDLIFSADAISMARKRIGEVLNQLQISSSGGLRKKRGAFDFGGSILHSLFGVATDAQIKDIRNNLLENLKLTYQNSKILERTVAAVNQHVGAINNLNKAVEEISKVFQKRLTDDEYAADLVAWGTRALDMIKEIHDNFLNFVDGIQLAVHGIISVYLIPPHQLKELIEFAQKQFNYIPVYEGSELLLYYQLMKISIQDFHVILEIPFDILQNNFELLTISSFPTYFNDKAIMAKFDFDYVIFNIATKEVILCSRKELNVCFKISEYKYLCPFNLFVRYPMTINTCEANIVFRDNYDNCGFTTYDKLLPFYARFQSFSALFFPIKVQLSLTCMNGEKTQTFYNDGFGALFLSHSCSLTSQVLNIHQGKHVKINRTFEIAPVLQYTSASIFQPRLEMNSITAHLSNVTEVVLGNVTDFLLPYNVTVAAVPAGVSFVLFVVITCIVCAFKTRIVAQLRRLKESTIDVVSSPAEGITTIPLEATTTTSMIPLEATTTTSMIPLEAATTSSVKPTSCTSRGSFAFDISK